MPTTSDRCEKFMPCSGMTPRAHCDWIDTRVFWSDVLAKHATQVAEALKMEPRIKAIVQQSRGQLDGEWKVRDHLSGRATTAKERPK